jgi:hypothetical protein
MLSVKFKPFKPSVVMLNVTMLSVIMLSVVAPFKVILSRVGPDHIHKRFNRSRRLERGQTPKCILLIVRDRRIAVFSKD